MASIVKSACLGGIALASLAIAETAQSQETKSPDTVRPTADQLATSGNPQTHNNNHPADIVVTGTLFAGTRPDGAALVQVLGAEEIVKQGSPSLLSIVKNITANQASFGESNRYLGEAGIATVNLRGFGANRTLVLFNGKRMAFAAAALQSDIVDINFVPNAAIGRIEVLKEGAAATYGSDAVAGVVNFITRRDLNTLELNANFTTVRKSDGDYDLSAAYGKVFDRGNFLVTASFRRRSELRTLERDWAILPFAQNPVGGWSTASNPGAFLTGTAAQLANGGFNQQFLDNGCTELGGVYINAANPSAGCRYRFALNDNLVNDEFHYQTYGEFNYEIASGLKLHLEALWAKHDVPRERVSTAQSTVQFPTPIAASGGSPGGGTSPYPAVGLNQQSRYYVPPGNPGLLAFLANPANCPALGAICANAAANGVVTSQTLWRPLGYGGIPIFTDQGGADVQQRKANALRFAGTLSGEIGSDTKWTAGVTWQRNRGYSSIPEFLVNRLQLALRGLGGPNCDPVSGSPGSGSCQYFNPFSNAFSANAATGQVNPFYVSGIGNSPELINWIRSSLITQYESRLFTVDGQISGKLPITLPGGRVQLAVGVQYRRNGYQVTPIDGNLDQAPCVDSLPYGDGTPTCTNGIGPYGFQASIAPFNVNRSVWAAFGEILLPVTDRFELTGALRFEDHGGSVGTTWNPKAAGRFQVTDFFALRGSFGTTFRAPPGELTADGFIRKLVALRLPGIGALYRPEDRYRNPDLKPERATTYNAGVVVEAGPFRGTIDYFRFNFRDELTRETAAQLVSAMFPSTDPKTFLCGNAEFRSRFTFADDGNPATDDCIPGNVLAVRSNFINGPSVKTSGIDASATFDFKNLVSDTDVMVGGDLTYTIDYKRSAVVTPDGIEVEPARDRAGVSELLSAFYSYPRWRANGFINLNRGVANLRWATHYKSGPTNIVTGLPNLKQRREMTHDLTINIDTPFGATLTASVQNLFDTDPPFTRSQYNYDYLTASILGRTFTLGLRQRF